MDFHFSLLDRNFHDLSAVRADIVVYCDTAKSSGRQRLAPTGLFCRQLESCKQARILGQQPPPVFHGIFTGRGCKLVDETFSEESVRRWSWSAPKVDTETKARDR